VSDEITQEDAEEILIAAQLCADVAKWAGHGWLGELAREQIPEYHAQERRLLAVRAKILALLSPP
jgi:hypothetical protein